MGCVYNFTRPAVLAELADDDVGRSRRMFSLAQSAFGLMPVVLGGPQCALNVVVLASLVAILRRGGNCVS